MNVCEDTSTYNGEADEDDAVAENATTATTSTTRQPKKRFCEICKKGFNTPGNFRRHDQQQHTANDTPEIIAERLKQNQRRNISRQARYATDAVYREGVKQGSKMSKKRVRIANEESAPTIADLDTANNEKMPNPASDSEGKKRAVKTDHKTGGKTTGKLKFTSFTRKEHDAFFATKPRTVATW